MWCPANNTNQHNIFECREIKKLSE
jgi:hypothetical protein